MVLESSWDASSHGSGQLWHLHLICPLPKGVDVSLVHLRNINIWCVRLCRDGVVNDMSDSGSPIVVGSCVAVCSAFLTLVRRHGMFHASDAAMARGRPCIQDAVCLAFDGVTDACRAAVEAQGIKCWPSIIMVLWHGT